MTITNTSTGEFHEVVIERVEIADYKRSSKARYFFKWSDEKKQELYKLRVAEGNDILGLVSIERIPEEWRIHIRLLTVTKENKGKNKAFDNIAGNLITFVSKIAVREYAELACVSLKPKGAIAEHYLSNFGFNATGMTLSIELTEILNLINIYDND